MAYLNPKILELLGLRPQAEDAWGYQPTAASPTPPSPVAEPAPSPYRSLATPEGFAQWRDATPEEKASEATWLAQRRSTTPLYAKTSLGDTIETGRVPTAEYEARQNAAATAQARSESLAADVAARARRFQGYDIQRLLSTAGAASKQPGGGLQWAIMAPALAQLMGQAGGTGQPSSGFQPTISIDAQGRPSLRLSPSQMFRPPTGEFSKERLAAEHRADAQGLTGDARSAFVTQEMAKYREAQSTAAGMGANAPGVVERKAAGAGAQAAARQGPQIPLTPSEATQAGVPMGTTRGGIAGTIPTTPQERKSITELDVSQNMLDHIGGLADQLITANDAASAAMQGIKLTAGAALRSNTAAAVFDDQRRALLGIFSRQIGAERGVLTDRDIERIDSALPKFRDTRAIKDQKMTFLRSMISTNRDARIRAIDSLLGTRSPIADGSRGITRKYDRSGNVIGGD